MSEIRKVKCDQCSRKVADRFTHIGWVRLNGSVTISEGRQKDGTATQTARCVGSEQDFCNLDCFMAYLRALQEKATQENRGKE
jgi:hypothetical protein